ncbi:MAG: ABC transporter ATP-binding protein [Propionibacteriaceae bacterium]
MSTLVDVEHGTTLPATLIVVRDLTITFPTAAGDRAAVYKLDVDIRRGEILGIVGESGSGKSTLALSLLNAVTTPGRIAGGSITIAGDSDITTWTGEKLRHYRGARVGYVFQASQNSMNPLKRIGRQLLDLGRSHGVSDLRRLLAEAHRLCDRMGLDGARVLDSYQHELSGGMRQRVGIIFALVLNAEVLILDEPTTALDMLSQVSVLEIVKEIHAERDLATIIITHDLGVVAEMADRLAVMYGGRLVELGPTQEIIRRPKHPYTAALMRAIPRIEGDPDLAQPLEGRPPDLASAPTQGCVFRDRCPRAEESCMTDDPPLLPYAGREIACPVVMRPGIEAVGGLADHLDPGATDQGR